MISVFIKEHKKYTEKDLCTMLECSNIEFRNFVLKLRYAGLLKISNLKLKRKITVVDGIFNEDDEDDDVEIIDSDILYFFDFVGIIIIHNRILKCYPKYINKQCQHEEFKQILRVIEKFKSATQVIEIPDTDSIFHNFSILSVSLFLLFDYFENGIYTKYINIFDDNCDNDILWDKTINESTPLFFDNRPYYIQLFTKNTMRDKYNFITRLHRCILTKISNEFKNTGLLEMFDFQDICLSNEQIDGFGEKDFIIYRILKEINSVFNTRKLLILNALLSYINESNNISDDDMFSFYGTNHFNMIWEYICSNVLDNQINNKLETLQLPTPLNHDKYDKKLRLIDLIEKPLWTATQTYSQKTLIPDFIKIIKSGSNFYFVIVDAKYYNPQFKIGCIPKKVPGIESISKQFLYQLAYMDFLNDHNIKYIVNCFVLPSEKEKIEVCGEIHFSMISKHLHLQNIKICFLPACLAFDYYLSDRKINFSEIIL